jgi:hypothetical protein
MAIDARVGCEVLKLSYDPCARTGRIHFPEVAYWDPTWHWDRLGTIRLFQFIDPDVEKIRTYAGTGELLGVATLQRNGDRWYDVRATRVQEGVPL